MKVKYLFAVRWLIGKRTRATYDTLYNHDIVKEKWALNFYVNIHKVIQYVILKSNLVYL